MQELQAGQLAVAGGGVFAVDHMAGLLAADAVAAFQHFFQHMAVPHISADELDPLVFAEFMQSQVGHDGGDNGVSVQLASRAHIHGADGHDLIAVDHGAGLVDQQAAVGVSVVSDADIVSVVYHGLLQGFQVGRTAALVDIDAVGHGVHDVGTGLEAGKQLRRRCGRRAVGTVHADPQPGEVVFDCGAQMLDILRAGLLHAADHGTDIAPALLRDRIFAEDEGFDLRLCRVGQFVALAVEDLDAVVLIGIVRSGDDDAGVRPALDRQVCHRGRGDHTQRHHIAAHGADAGDQRGFQHIRGNAGVLSQGDLGSSLLFLRQNGGHRLADAVRHIGGQRLAHDAANPVGAE